MCLHYERSQDAGLMFVCVVDISPRSKGSGLKRAAGEGGGKKSQKERLLRER